MKKILCFLSIFIILICNSFSVYAFSNYAITSVYFRFYSYSDSSNSVAKTLNTNSTFPEYSEFFDDAPEGYHFIGWSRTKNSPVAEFPAGSLYDGSLNTSGCAVYPVFALSESVTNVNVDMTETNLLLSNTNKILNNIFCIIVFTVIYCYFLNPLIKILKFRKGDR